MTGRNAASIPRIEEIEMSFTDFYMIVPSAFISGLIWFVLLAMFLYIARDPAHQAINALSRVLHNAMRLSANAVLRWENWMLQPMA